MRKHYLDNLRWITVAVVVLYHVIYMFNNLQPFGVIGGFYENQWWDHFQTFCYPWFMVLLFSVAGMSARFSLENRTAKEFAKSRTDKLFVPVSLGLLLFHWITGWVNMAISHAFDDMGAVPALVRYLIQCASGIGVLWFLQNYTDIGSESVGIVMMVSNVSVGICSGIAAVFVIKHIKKKYDL